MSDSESVMHWFGKQDLGLKFAIVLGALIVLTFAAGIAKLIYTKQKLKKHARAAEISKSEAKEELHVLNKREEDEGDLFGIRALEKGFYGGVAQSRPATPVSMGSTLVPPRSVHDPSRASSDSANMKPLSGRDAVDMHLVVPPSPTFPRRNETRSPSPTGSTNSQINAPQIDLTMPSSGLSIQTYSNRPTSPRIQTSQYANGNGNHSGSGIPTVTVSDDGYNMGNAPGSRLQHHENAYLNGIDYTTGLGDNMKNRSSTASYEGIYDSYYGNRMSAMPEGSDDDRMNYSYTHAR